MTTEPLPVRLDRLLHPGPHGSHLGHLVNGVIGVSIVASVVIAILETEDTVTVLAPALFHWADKVFGAIFLVEYVVRLIAAGADPRYRGWKGRLRYAVSPMALLDLLAVLPLLLHEIVGNTQMVRLLRLFRILRFSRIGPFARAARLLMATLQSRLPELALALLMALVILIVSATLMYMIEGEHQPQGFGSIPRAMWWAIATLTTVGYGDVFPLTPLGKVLGGITALAAIGIIAAPTGILATSFAEALRNDHAAQEAERAARRKADADGRP